MNSALRARITQLHYPFQHELLPLIERDFDERLSPVLQRIVRTLECVQIGQALARAFVRIPMIVTADSGHRDRSQRA